MAWIHFSAVFDTHGDEIDREAERAFFEFNEIWKPKIRVHGGDAFDFRQLRRGASEEEKCTSMESDYEAGMDFLTRYQPNHYALGNHCIRLWDLANQPKDGILKDYAKRRVREIETACKQFKCKIYPYDSRKGIVRLGNLKIIHGYGKSGGIMAARRAALTYGSVLQGHYHNINHVSIEGLENRIGRTCGCLLRLDQEYARADIGRLMWRHGWPYGVINDRTGKYQVWQAEKIDGKWLLPTGIREI